jgi:hypothetical protein
MTALRTRQTQAQELVGHSMRCDTSAWRDEPGKRGVYHIGLTEGNAWHCKSTFIRSQFCLQMGDRPARSGCDKENHLGGSHGFRPVSRNGPVPAVNRYRRVKDVIAARG